MYKMEYKYISHIDSPADLKKLKVEELPAVCAELRDFIIEALSKNPGHLASSLGAIELTVALHYVFDTPNDQLVWDVGHQAYAHKILTGRRDRFHTNRQFKGLSPFTNPAESEYDAFIAGHASNSISAALGIDIAGRTNKKRNVVAIIGDGAMTGGLAFEGLNNTSMDKNNLQPYGHRPAQRRFHAVPGRFDDQCGLQQMALAVLPSSSEIAPRG